jgi:hypothetical protein
MIAGGRRARDGLTPDISTMAIATDREFSPIEKSRFRMSFTSIITGLVAVLLS